MVFHVDILIYVVYVVIKYNIHNDYVKVSGKKYDKQELTIFAFLCS